MAERADLRNRINVMLFHFDQRLGPRLLFNVAEIQDARITASLTRLMDFNFLEENRAFVNAMANVVYSSMFFSIPNPIARGGVEQFMLSFVIFDPTITEYLTISSLEEEMSKIISKLILLSEMFIIITYTNPVLEDFPEVESLLKSLRDNTISVFQEIFIGQIEGTKDAISQVLGKIGFEAGKQIAQGLRVDEKGSVKAYTDALVNSPILSRWGNMNILHFDPGEKVATISLDRSIWTESLGVIATKTCAFIEGMLEAIFSKILDEPIICDEMRCASEYSYVKDCIFQIAPGGSNREIIAYKEDQTIKDMGAQEREKAMEAINADIGEQFYQELDPMIRLIQLFNKAHFISDHFIQDSEEEVKFLVVCNYWRYPNEILCNSCEKWIRKSSKVPVKLLKSKHRICEITYETEN